MRARLKWPIIFSHSNPSALVPNPRNIDDEQIAACARRGGVLCLAPWGPLVMRPKTSHRPTVDDFVNLIDHVANLTESASHIGIGTDMSLGSYPEHEHDAWGGPDYGNPFAEYGEKITADQRSPKRNLDGFDDFAQVVNLVDRLRARAAIRPRISARFSARTTFGWRPKYGRPDAERLRLGLTTRTINSNHIQTIR